MKVTIKGRHVNLGCHLFKHKWKYVFSSIVSIPFPVRVCTRCSEVQQHLTLPAYGTSWFTLCSYTDKGAKDWADKSGIKL